jgi:hypothetical protein
MSHNASMSHSALKRRGISRAEACHLEIRALAPEGVTFHPAHDQNVNPLNPRLA